MSVDLMQATVQLEQPLGDGTRTVGTGFLVSDPTPDGRPRVVLITANHVFNKMPGDRATIGYRIENADGSWSYAPQTFAIRSHGHELWTQHGSRDVAAIAINVPPAFAKAAIPKAWLADEGSFAANGVGPGDEMMALGFPKGLSSNAAGFPILRAGRVASYPLAPTKAFPTFLLDFSVFPGNSGGPVYVPVTHKADGSAGDPLIAGILTQEVELGSQNLEIGIVTQARFIKETLALLDDPRAPQAPQDSTPASLMGIPVAATADSAAVAR
ncbi:MAG TPA: trypsin-like peptidase domain-containing protein [Caulobacteraceae bacterium]|nr:trypsin-like peptidase domain-containing protein [Caulobacteraceae bacterium]